MVYEAKSKAKMDSDKQFQSANGKNLRFVVAGDYPIHSRASSAAAIRWQWAVALLAAVGCRPVSMASLTHWKDIYTHRGRVFHPSALILILISHAPSRHRRAAQCGKSTLFNALTRSRKRRRRTTRFARLTRTSGRRGADDRLRAVKSPRRASSSPRRWSLWTSPGWSRARQGRGLGNNSGHIREVSAIVHVVRCFEDPTSSTPWAGWIPVRTLRLFRRSCCCRLESAQSQLIRARAKAKGHDKEGVAQMAFYERVIEHLGAGKRRI